MNIRWRILMAASGFFIVVAALIGIFYYMTYVRVDMSTIEYIGRMQIGPNKFNDLSGDINVESGDDIGYIIRGDYQIDIHYGSQIISMNKNCFKSQEYLDKLNKIGIKVQSHQNDDGSILYRVTYWGDPVEELSRAG